MNTGLRNLDDRLRDHFRQGVVAILDAEGMQRLLVSRFDAANLVRLHSAKDVPANCLAVGNPARVLRQTIATGSPP
jgi:hypothetical protein